MTALLKVNLGTPPTAVDGDTSRDANSKANSNVDVLNTQAALTSSPAVITAAQALTAAAHIGKRVNISLAAAGVINLPAASTCLADQVTLLRNIGTTIVTLAVTTGSGDTLALSRLNPGESALMDTDGVHAWNALMRGRTSSDNEVVNGNCAVNGNETVGGTLAVAGNTTLGGTLGVAGLAILAGGASFGASGQATISSAGAYTGASASYTGALAVGGNVTVTGTLGVTGTSSFTGAATFAVRPTFAGKVPYDTGNLNPLSNGATNNTNGLVFASGLPPNLAAATGNAGQLPALVVTNAGNPSASACIAFNRQGLASGGLGSFAAYLGIDSVDNGFRIGGWSFGTNSYRLLHEGLGGWAGQGTYSAPNWVSTSDRNLKRDIETIPDAAAKVLAMRGTYFAFKTSPDKRQVGVIAQEMQEVIPEVVEEVEGPDGSKHLAVSYGPLAAVLIEAFKTLHAKVSALEEQIANNERHSAA